MSTMVLSGRWPRRRVSAPGRAGTVVGWSLLTLVVAVVVFGDLFWAVPGGTADYGNKLSSPSLNHPLGTDGHGRDQLARIIEGGRRSLRMTGVILAGVVSVSLLLGMAAAMLGRVVDAVVSRSVDVILAVPTTVLALALVGVLGPGQRSLMIAMVASMWAGYTRISRSLAVQARGRGDVRAARQAGRGRLVVITGHIVPHVVRQLLVLASLDIGSVLVVVAGLSFLGLGVQAPDAEWGAMLSESRLFLASAPWLLAAPTLAIVVTVLAANLVGESLRDRLTPSARS